MPYVISRTTFVTRRLFYLTIAVAVSGCAQGPPTSPPPAYFGMAQTSASPAAHFYGNDLMYMSQPSGNDVVVYKRKKNSATLTYDKTLTGFSRPMGMVTTPDGQLYIANSGDSSVLVYRTTRKGPKGPIATLDDTGEVPINVDARPNRRLVAVSNASTTNGGAGSVSVYLNRRANPSRMLTYGSDPIQGEGIAIDAKGNCYWSFNDLKTLIGSIVEFAGCRGSGTLFESGILFVGGVAFDKSGDLYFVDQLAGIYKCSGPSSCSIFLPVGSLFGLLLPKDINFDNSQPQNLWVADAAGYIDAVNLEGILFYALQVVGGITDPPDGVAPAPGS
jgi:hypothetical protein